MSETHYVADVRADVTDELVTFRTTDPQLLPEDPSTTSEWRLDLDEDDPKSAMFDLRPASPSSRVVLARSRPAGGDWTNWTEQAGRWCSPAFHDGDDFTLEVQVSNASGAIRHGSGYFRVRDTGGGDDLAGPA